MFREFPEPPASDEDEENGPQEPLPPAEMLREFEDEETPAADNDEESGPHDQLPSVEEYKTQVATAERKQGEFTKLHCFAFVSFAIALSVVSLSIGLAVGREEAIQEVYEDLEKDGFSFPQAVSPVEPAKPSLIVEYTKIVKKQGWSTPKSVDNPDSVQYKAIQWLGEKDKAAIELEDLEVFKERYALTVFYFALNGDEWKHDIHFLSEEKHCKWHQLYYGDITWGAGAICKDGVVTELLFPGFGMRGFVPPEIGLLSNLETLHLSGNKLRDEEGSKSSIPTAIEFLVKLRRLNLAENQLVGRVPTWLGGLTKLAEINFKGNYLSGELPSDLGSGLNLLLKLDMEQNKLEGPLYHLKGLSSVQAILLGNNTFSGELEEDVYLSWPNLQALDLSSNKLSGSLPPKLFTLKTLGVLDLHDNQFTGNLPDLVSLETDVRFLALHKNQLSGGMLGLLFMEQLEHLDLSHNNFVIQLPDVFGGLKSLRYLFLAYNEFVPGPIPTNLGALPNLVDLSLQGTNRVGKIPVELGDLKKLKLLDLNNNALSGRIPSELGNMRSIVFLLLKDNQLKGGVPESFSQLKHLHTFVFNNNRMTNGNASAICETSRPRSDFVSDCSGNFKCTCCVCCNDFDPDVDYSECKDRIWYAGLDPVYSEQYQFEREFYAFHSEHKTYPTEIGNTGLSIPSTMMPVSQPVFSPVELPAEPPSTTAVPPDLVGELAGPSHIPPQTASPLAPPPTASTTSVPSPSVLSEFLGGSSSMPRQTASPISEYKGSGSSNTTTGVQSGEP